MEATTTREGIAFDRLPPDHVVGTCVRCGGPTARPDWLACLRCAATWDDETTDRFVEARDQLAAWLRETHDFLETVPTDSPIRIAGEARWRGRLRTYQILCWMTAIGGRPERVDA